MNYYSLLARVAPSLTSQSENLATKSLLYILQRYGTAHEAFVDVGVHRGLCRPEGPAIQYPSPHAVREHP